MKACRRAAFVFFFLGALRLASVDGRGGGEWVVLENCRLVLNPANDGDSFHACVGDKEYIFRLALVDAPETKGTEPSRLIEQAKYFEITVPRAIEVGDAATAFTQAKLSEPFVVFTRMSGAPGRSNLERLYAFVQTKEGDLGEQLVWNGLARVHGVKAIPPGLSSSQPELQKLQQFEDAARTSKIGGWGINSGRLKVHPKESNAFTFFARANEATIKSASPTPGAPKPIASTTDSSPTESTALGKKEKVAPGTIDINSATEKELRTIPGIGPVMAKRIIAARPFASADELRKVNGIGPKKYEKMRSYFK